MKKLRVMAMASQREALLEELLRLGCVEISEPAGKLSDPAWAALLRRDTSTLAETKNEQGEANAALADDIAHSGDPEYLADIARSRLGLLEPEEYQTLDWGGDPGRVDYAALYRNRFSVLRLACSRLGRGDKLALRGTVGVGRDDLGAPVYFGGVPGGHALPNSGRHSYDHTGSGGLFGGP